MRYSTQPRDQKYIKEYGFLSLAKKSDGKYSKKLMVTATTTAKNRGMDEKLRLKELSKNGRGNK